MSKLILFVTLIPFVSLADDISPLKKALERQSEHQSVSVIFRQTKKSPALNEPIETMGKLWLVPGKSFRWELGKPAKKTVVFNGDDVLVLDEEKRTGQRLSRDHKTVKPLFLTLGMGEEGSFDQLAEVFNIVGTDEKNGRFSATFTPKPRSLRKVLRSFFMQVNLETSFLERIGWVQKDGTEAITEFFKPILNQDIPAEKFRVTESAYQWEK